MSDDATSQSPPAEKVAFGNEVDFYGKPVSGLSQVGFRVFQTGENAAISPQQHAEHLAGDQPERGQRRTTHDGLGARSGVR